MNTFNIIVTLAVPIIVVGYIVYDLLVSKYAEKDVKMFCYKKETKNWHGRNLPERGQNGGKYFSRKEILEEAQCIIEKMF